MEAGCEDEGGRFLQPISDKKRAKENLCKFRILGNKKKIKRLRAFIGSKSKDKNLSVEELHLIAETVRDLGSHDGIVINSADHYWKKFHILLSGILSVVNTEAMEELSSLIDDWRYEKLDEEERACLDKWREESRESLKDWWDIHDNASAIYTIHWLLRDGHARRYDEFAACSTFEEAMEVDRKTSLFWIKEKQQREENTLSDDTSLDEIIALEVKYYMQEHYEDIKDYQYKILDKRKPDWDNFDAAMIWRELEEYFIEEFKEEHIKYVKDNMDFIRLLGVEKAICLNAWDIGRCANVIRWSYSFGYISEETAWFFLDKNSRRAIREYRSFGDFAHDYMLGRFFWQGGTSGYVDVDSTYMMLDAIKYLFDEEKGMWTQNPWISKVEN